MAVITFSRVFPSYHPRKGEPTFFVEQILNAIAPKKSNGIVDMDLLSDEVKSVVNDFVLLAGTDKKSHTIRSGHRWKAGQKFSPRVWTGKPYNSSQLEIAPPIEIKKIFNFEMDLCGVYSVNGKYLDELQCPLLAKNDGLTEDDMFHWFMPNYDKPKKFIGQIICWNPEIKY